MARQEWVWRAQVSILLKNKHQAPEASYTEIPSTRLRSRTVQCPALQAEPCCGHTAGWTPQCYAGACSERLHLDECSEGRATYSSGAFLLQSTSTEILSVKETLSFLESSELKWTCHFFLLCLAEPRGIVLEAGW